MAKIPRVNKYECCGCALCVYALPEVFRLNPDGYSEVIEDNTISAKEIQKVMDDCPVRCVHWYEKGSK